jgi:hypothetical protein
VKDAELLERLTRPDANPRILAGGPRPGFKWATLVEVDEPPATLILTLEDVHQWCRALGAK